MKILSALLLTVSLAILAPAVSLGQTNNVLVVDATGHLHVQIDGPLDHVDKTTPMVVGRIEIAEGPFIHPVGKLFTLTRLNLHFADFSIKSRSLGEKPLPLVQVGVQLRDAVAWWGIEQQPGVYKIDIPHDAIHITGDPSFIGSARVHDSYFVGPHKIDQRHFQGVERISEPIAGFIDLNTGTIQATAVLTTKGEALGGLAEVERKLTITLVGTIVTDPCGATKSSTGKVECQPTDNKLP